MISDTVKQFVSEYPQYVGTPFGYNHTTELLVNRLPNQLYKSLDISHEDYLIRGSVGNGKWAEIPWFAIMHRGVTSSTQTGYYVVGLLSKDMRTLHIALGLGWTQFQDEYGAKVGREKITAYASKLAKLLPGNEQYHQGTLSLGATSSRAKGYESSNAVWHSIDIADLDDSSLLADIKSLLESYAFLRDNYGADLYFNKELDIDDEPIEPKLAAAIRTQSATANKSQALMELQSIADTLPPKKRKRYVSEIIRNAAFANYVKERSNYICEICGKLPFNKTSGKPYAEADHVEPLYMNGRDHPDNMRCLCAQCHRILTYGSKDEIDQLKKIRITDNI